MNLKKRMCLFLIMALLWGLLCAAAEPAQPPWQQPAVEDRLYTVDDFAVTDGLPNTWLNILLMGSDEKYTTRYGYTDGMILLSVNLASRQAKLTSFMRDIWVTVGDKSKAGKLCALCQTDGPAMTMRAINECFGMNIEYYALVNLSGMAEIIDLLGGLDMDITAEEMSAINIGLFDLSPWSGMQYLDEYGSDVHLNGNQAAAYARIRRIDSDYQRTRRQRYLINRIAHRLQQEDSGTIVGVVMKLMDCVETNMSMTQLMTIAAVGLKTDLNYLEEFRIPVEDSYTTGSVGGTWAMKVDYEENRKRLHQFIYG